MSGWYETNHETVELKPSADANFLVRMLAECVDESSESFVDVIEEEQDTEYITRFDFSFDQDESCGGAAAIDDALLALAPHVVKAFKVKGEFDHQKFSFWVGNGEALVAGKSSRALETATGVLKDMTPGDLSTLKARVDETFLALNSEDL